MLTCSVNSKDPGKLFADCERCRGLMVSALDSSTGGTVQALVRQAGYKEVQVR